MTELELVSTQEVELAEAKARQLEQQQQQEINRSRKTTNSPSMARRAQSRSPVRCVCDLCDCGSHTCSSLVLRAQPTDAESAQSNRWPTANDDYARSELEQQMGVAQEERKCQCSAMWAQEERFLTARANNNNNKSVEGEKVMMVEQAVGSSATINNHDDDGDNNQQLLHVLVTRPQIASKPRDHILFEGDMDLKTTFETSYEALAKMRLEQWKKYQDSKLAADAKTTTDDDQQQLSSSAVKRSVTVTPDKQHNRLQQINDNHNQHDTKRINEEVSVQASKGKEKRGSQQQQPVVDVAFDQQQQQQQHQQQTVAPSDGTNELALKCATPTTAAAAAAQLSSTKAKDDFIDPDLSSIIVYDANMNRLEKVGVRKRSKYRPSTSLRSGARGLFGDQDELKPDNNRQPQRHQQSTVNDFQTLTKATPLKSAQRSKSPIEIGAQVALQRNLNKTNQASGLIFSDQNLHVESKRRVRDNVNMTDHIKEQNIVENSNYRNPRATDGDHHSFVKQKPDLNIQHSPDNNNNNYYYNNQDELDSMVRENFEKVVTLADQEEQEAVREIQRVTANAGASYNSDQAQAPAPATPDYYNTANGAASKASGFSLNRSNTPSTGQSQSKLQRTCQNQNFYLYENDYPSGKQVNQQQQQQQQQQQENGLNETPESGRITVNRNAQVTPSQLQPASRFSYNNLFRESPDFLLTTGKFMESEAKSITKTSTVVVSKVPDQTINSSDHNYQQQHSSEQNSQIQPAISGQVELVTGSEENDNYRENHEKLTREDCRVLKLNEDFHYVGSQMGHKYFVEKQISKSMLEYE